MFTLIPLVPYQGQTIRGYDCPHLLQMGTIQSEPSSPSVNAVVGTPKTFANPSLPLVNDTK